MIELAVLNGLPSSDFVAALDGIFEHSAWVAERTAPGRPFDSRLRLLDALRHTVDDAPVEWQRSLIRAHPQLGTRGRARPHLTAASAREQQRAGLDACTDEELDRLTQLNAAYVGKFAMPFILAVRGHDPASIIASVERRLMHGTVEEESTALREIGKIAGYRLADVVVAPMGGEVWAMGARLAAADRAQGDALLREWMWAAHLEVSSDGGGRPLGRRRGTEPQATTVMLGSPRRDSGPVLLAIAVLHRLRQEARSLPFDVLVAAEAAQANGRAGIDVWEGGAALGPSAAWDGGFAERAAQSLETFLLRNEQRLIDGGSTSRHG